VANGQAGAGSGGGLVYGLAAYGWWGLMPLYFRAVDVVGPWEVLAHRVVWCLAFLVAVLTLGRRWPDVARCLRTRRLLGLLLLSSVLVAINWLVYVYGVSTRRIAQTSLGYFMNPLFSMLLGMVFFRERLRPWQWVAAMLATAGVLYHVGALGETPWIALALMSSFGLYGLVRKVAAVDGLLGLAVETLVLLPAALVFLACHRAWGTPAFGNNGWWVDGLLLAGGVITAIPLLCFGEAARRLPLTTLGFLQYLAPSMQLALAVLVYEEHFGQEHAVTFGLIWTGLVLFSLESLLARRREAEPVGDPPSCPTGRCPSAQRLALEAGRRLPVVLLAGLGVLCLVPAIRADDDEPGADDIPLVGRPPDLPFSEASGRFEASTRAEPTVLEAETPLTLTLTVRGVGTVRRPPRRLDLRQWSEWPKVKEAFFVEDLPDPPMPDPKTWVFAWRVKPRRPDVAEIPGIPFVYYNPDIPQESKRFQVWNTDPIPLKVRPRAEVAVPVPAPASAFEIATGPAVLSHRTSLGVPGPILLVVLLLAPPLGGAAWYLCWRRLYPDAARRAQQHRSRAANRALRLLHEARRLAPPASAEAVAAAVTGYLHGRLDLGPNEPTPAEAQAHLRGPAGLADLGAQAADFYRACDAARFLPAGGGDRDLVDEAVRFILAVEAATCQPVS
jgi:chloramphenicol-sensitive protein RarD